MNVGILTSGGDCQALNAAMRGVAKTLYNKCPDIKIIGIENGYTGMIYGRSHEMFQEDFSGLLTKGGTILGTAREPFKHIADIGEDGVDKVKSMEDFYYQNNLDCLVILGGNGSIKTAALLSSKGLNIVALPKTIDNDLAITDHTPGFGSAAKYIATTLKELVCDCRIYDCPAVTIVEIMGRNAGWLTAAAGLVRGEDCEGVDLIFLPEKVFDVNFFMKRVKEVVAEKKYCVVALSEGVRIADGRFVCELSADDAAVDAFGHKMMSGSAKYLETLVKNEMGIKARAIEISTLQRCASHFASLTDIEEAFDCGAAAVRAAVINNETG